jgi:Zn-dependent protease with chaperone function
MPQDAGTEPVTWRPSVPESLAVSDYALDEDRRALKRLRTLAPLVYATRMYLRHVGEPVVRAQLLGGAVRVGGQQFPGLDALIRDCARVLHMPVPDVFVVQNPMMNAHTYGHEQPIVVLNSGLVDAMTDAELAFTLGHEFGHIKSEHVLYLNLAEFLRTGAALAVQWAAAPAALALFAWQRYAEHTADRAGFIACQRLEDAQSALIKLALGSQRLSAEVNVEEYLRQAGQLDTLPARAAVALQGHPYTARRVVALRAYARSSDYAALWGDGVPDSHDATSIAPIHRLGRVLGAAAAECKLYGRVAGSLVQRRFRRTVQSIPLAEALRIVPPGDERHSEARPDEEPV